MKILYLHGIGSGANSRTPRELRKYFPDIEIIAPELPARPKDAVKYLSDNYALEDEIDLVIGTSLGGFYALTLPMVKKLLINPEYSCAMKSHFRKSGNQMSGKWKSSFTSLLA